MIPYHGPSKRVDDEWKWWHYVGAIAMAPILTAAALGLLIGCCVLAAIEMVMQPPKRK